MFYPVQLPDGFVVASKEHPENIRLVFNELENTA